NANVGKDLELRDVIKEPTSTGDVVLGHWTVLVQLSVVVYFKFTLVRGIVLPFLVNCSSPSQRRLCVVRKRKRAGHVASSSTSAGFLFFDILRFFLLFYFYWDIQWEPSLQRREELHWLKYPNY
ncbi:unnamed protein product, partial [Porites evermanni]